jgi:isocitrate/isopropylmalate dehydrogenase
MAYRPLATAARKTLRIGLIPADGIGREVIPVSEAMDCAFGSRWVHDVSFHRRHAELWKLWVLTSPSSSSVTC